MKDTLSIAAAILVIAATIPYIIDIIRGRSKPNIVSWFTWVILLAIATAAAFADHQRRIALLTLGDLIGTGLVLLLGLKFGIAKFTKLDVFCQLGAVAGLVLWVVFNSPFVAIVSTILIDFIAVIPTLNHAWRAPQEETWQSFALVALASVITLFSLSSYTAVSLAYPVYLPLTNAVVVGVILLRRQRLGISLSRTGANEAIHG